VTGRRLPDKFKVVIASPYTMLAKRDETGTGEVLVLPLPRKRAAIGPWLLAELKNEVAKLGALYTKAKEKDANMACGLSLRSGEAHVVPLDDPEVDVVVNPKYLIDGLGAWPADLCWEGPSPIVVRTSPDRAGETRYWVACIVNRK
jgi:hypothetical protein